MFVAITVLLVVVLRVYARSRNPASLERESRDRNLVSQTPVVQPLEGFDWRSEEPRRFRPFKPIFHMSMALQSDSPSDLIVIDKNYLQRVSLRRDLIRQHGSRVHGCVPGGEDAVRELYGFLMGSYLPTRYPTMFKLSGDRKHVENSATKLTYPSVASSDLCAALRTLGESVEDDMFLLRETPQGHESVAVVCCFAAGFDPATKLGKLLKDIHGPVPSYEKIGPSMERFFGKLQVGKSVKRLNWTVQPHSRLPVYEAHAAENDSAREEIKIEQTFLRVELQTLTRLPQTQAVLFSFKTYMYPIQQIKDEGLGPDLATAIHGLKAGNAPRMWTYKGATQWSEDVCAYLRS
ncbi:hypothetical protein HIM_00800 [Hirsutella minnesotensis 3608]|nr:hypothetical protein HIM_00800 [Hirsutella minnesotensis 3608]